MSNWPFTNFNTAPHYLILKLKLSQNYRETQYFSTRLTEKYELLAYYFYTMTTTNIEYNGYAIDRKLPTLVLTILHHVNTYQLW